MTRKNSKGMSGHHRGYRGHTNEWLTPPSIIKALGSFYLDPCSPVDRPWNTACKHFTIEDNGLAKPWAGRVWLNPPYGPDTALWLARLAEHGNGTALIFARTETRMFFENVWTRADSLLFIHGRLHFHHLDGSRAKANAGAPSVLVAYGSVNTAWLIRCGLGAFVRLKDNQ